LGRGRDGGSPARRAAGAAMAKSIFHSIMDFRLNIDPEFQGWVLLFATMTAIWLFCMPCYCAGLSSSMARRFASAMNKRLLVFYAFMLVVNGALMFLIITWLPDWDYADYIACCLAVVKWMGKNISKFVSSIVIIVAFFIAVIFKDRIALMLGLDHHTIFRCKIRDCFYGWSPSRFRAIEMVIWKVEDLTSADVFSANNVFVEVYMGYNEAMKTRVHNNAGSACSIKETLQLNFDEDDDEEHLFIFVKNQKVMGSATLGRVELRPDMVAEVERKGREALLDPAHKWEERNFVQKKLIPRGTIWFRLSPVADEDNEGLMKTLGSC